MKDIRLFVTNILLAGIFTVLLLIWQRMPPTVADFAAAKGNKEAQTALTARQPIVHAYPDFSLPEPLRVEVDNSTLNVRVVDTPIEVRAVR